MNFRRGLFRFWLIAAVIFASCTMVLAVWSFKEQADALAYENVPNDPYRGVGVPANPPHPWTSLGVLTLVAFGVPVTVLVFGRALLWAADGFRATKS